MDTVGLITNREIVKGQKYEIFIVENKILLASFSHFRPFVFSCLKKSMKTNATRILDKLGIAYETRS